MRSIGEPTGEIGRRPIENPSTAPGRVLLCRAMKRPPHEPGRGPRTHFVADVPPAPGADSAPYAGGPRFSRTAFLAGAGRAAVGSAALASMPAWARSAIAAAAGPSDFIERNDWPEHWETTIAALGRSS